MSKYPLTLGALSLGLWGFAAVGSATPVTYDVVSGSSSNIALFASNANNGNSLLSDGMLPMTPASLVEFDGSANTLPNVNFSDTGPTTLALSGSLANFSLRITNLAVAPESPYSSTVTATGAGAYNFTLGELDASGSWQLIQNSTGNPVSGQSGTINHAIPNLNGQFTVTGLDMQNMTLTGISLGQVTIEGTAVNLSADVTFNGATAVPVPATLWLLGSGFVGLVSATRRRRQLASA